MSVDHCEHTQKQNKMNTDIVFRVKDAYTCVSTYCKTCESVNATIKGQCKVVLKVASIAEIKKLGSKASKLDLSVAIIQDKGLTQLPANTVTCIAIGPGPTKLIDDVTGHLRLL